MKLLKSWFPLSFRKKGDLLWMIVTIIVYLVIGGIVSFIAGFIPLSIIRWAVSVIIDLYCLVGIIISVLAFFKAV